MFVDRAKIHVKAGNGGDGAVSFLRAKYVPNGGPDGGDGGRGGDVIFVADEGFSTLLDFRYQKTFKAMPGENGSGHNRSGKSSEDVVVKVPVGTVIREAVTGKVMADMSKAGEKRVIAKGGRGGRGNQNFATSTRQAPRYAEKGKMGRDYEIILELKLIADAGIIGFPNAGKSTLLSMVTNATPKIAGYRFTTLSPNLGVVRSDKRKDFVLADIPGLIEGASEGQGLGHHFLRHIERTKILVHVVDASGLEGEDPVDLLEMVNKELEAYNPELLKRPQIIAANKMDILEAQENLARIQEYAAEHGYQVFPISAAGNQGLEPLMEAVGLILDDYPQTIVFGEDYEEYEELKEDKAPFKIDILDDGSFQVEGPGIERMIGYTSLESEKGFAFFQKYMVDKGVIAALEEAGAKEGDTVYVHGLTFDYIK